MKGVVEADPVDVKKEVDATDPVDLMKGVDTRVHLIL
jgi:hypothetical protein